MFITRAVILALFDFRYFLLQVVPNGVEKGQTYKRMNPEKVIGHDKQRTEPKLA